MATDLVGPTPNLKRHFLAHAATTSHHSCKSLLTIRHHHEVISIELGREAMMGQEAHAGCQLPNAMHQFELESECHGGNGT